MDGKCILVSAPISRANHGYCCQKYNPGAGLVQQAKVVFASTVLESAASLKARRLEITKRIATPRLFCAEDARVMARRRIAKIMFDYVDGAAGNETAARLNQETLDQIRLQPGCW